MFEVSIMFFAGFLLGIWGYRKHVKDPTYFATRLQRIFHRNVP